MKAMRMDAFTQNAHQHHRSSNQQATDINNDDSNRTRNLKKFLEKATYVPPRERDLQNDDQAYNDQHNDDYVTADGEQAINFGFDPTQYSIAYHSCAKVRQFDDKLAAQEDSHSVFATKHLAVFRLCPSKTCEGISEESAEMNYWAAQAYQAAEGQEGGQQQQGQGGADYSNSQYGTEGENLFNRLRVGGANGEGCQSNYGEYMLELDVYIGIMTEYRSERLEKYCETCEACMYDAYQNWLKNSGYRKLKERADQSWKEDLDSDEFQKHRELGYNPYEACPEYDTCKYHENVCKTSDDDSLLTKYFQCTEVEGNDGSVNYIGPYCSNDGITITLGVFADEGCNEYIGNSVNIENLLGFEVDEDSLIAPYLTGSMDIEYQQENYSSSNNAELAKYYSPIDQICIPCKASRQPYEVRVNGGNVDDDYQDENETDINGLCENLYMVSARCDKLIRSYNSQKHSFQSYIFQRYSSNQARAQERLSCNFIGSIVMNNFDDMGFIVVSEKISNSPQYDSVFQQEVTTIEIFGLIFALLACTTLAIWSYFLNNNIKNQKHSTFGRDQLSIYMAPSVLSEAFSKKSFSKSFSGSTMLDLFPRKNRSQFSVASSAYPPDTPPSLHESHESHRSHESHGTVGVVEALRREIEDLQHQLEATNDPLLRTEFSIGTVDDMSEIKGSWHEPSTTIASRPLAATEAKQMKNDSSKNDKTHVVSSDTHLQTSPETLFSDHLHVLDTPNSVNPMSATTANSAPPTEAISVTCDSFGCDSSTSHQSCVRSSSGTEVPSRKKLPVVDETTPSNFLPASTTSPNVDTLQKQIDYLQKQLAAQDASAVNNEASVDKRSELASTKKLRGRIKKIFGKKQAKRADKPLI